MRPIQRGILAEESGQSAGQVMTLALNINGLLIHLMEQPISFMDSRSTQFRLLLRNLVAISTVIFLIQTGTNYLPPAKAVAHS